MHNNISGRRSSYPSRTDSKSENRNSSSKRRNESPRSRKSYLSTPRSSSSFRRSMAHNDRDHSKHSKKAQRSSKTRSTILSPRRLSNEPSCSYSKNKDLLIRKRGSSRTGSPDLRHEGERFQADDEYVVNKPLFRGPEKDILNDRDSLKKIVINMREVPTEVNTIKRQIINPEDITIVRRAGEGSRPIFERDEIINHRRKLEEEEERYRRRSLTSPDHSDFRFHQIRYQEDRNQKSMNCHRSRSSPSDYDSWTYSKFREERRSGSYERSSRRYDTSPERLGERYFRRGCKSPNCRRFEECRNADDMADRLAEWRGTENEYSDVEYVSVNSKYEADDMELATPTVSGGLLTNTQPRRAIPNRTFAAPEIFMCPLPRVRPIRTTFIPRPPAVPVVRFPFPPRIIRPVLRPIAPAMPPIFRHPYIPFPY